MPYSNAIATLTDEVAADEALLKEKQELLTGLRKLQASRSESTMPQEATRTPPPDSLAHQDGDDRSNTNLAATVLNVLRLAGAPLATGDIFNRVCESGYQFTGQYPRQRVSTVLDRLAEDGAVVKTHHGRGRSPHVYALAQT